MSATHTAPSDSVPFQLLPAPDEKVRHLEDERARSAFYDRHTGLVSRPLCMNRLEHALADTSRHKPGLAVIALAPDGSPPGGAWNEPVLSALGGKLKNTLRAADTAAHFGEGLFVVIVTEISSALDAARVAQRLIDVAQMSILDDHALPRPITVSAGVALSRFCGAAPQAASLVEEACLALRGARTVKPAFVHVVTPHDHDHEDDQPVEA